MYMPIASQSHVHVYVWVSLNTTVAQTSRRGAAGCKGGAAESVAAVRMIASLLPAFPYDVHSHYSYYGSILG